LPYDRTLTSTTERQELMNTGPFDKVNAATVTLPDLAKQTAVIVSRLENLETEPLDVESLVKQVLRVATVLHDLIERLASSSDALLDSPRAFAIDTAPYTGESRSSRNDGWNW